MDVATTLSLVETQVELLLDGEIEAVVEESAPIILDASEQAEIAEMILSEPLILRLPDAAEGDPGPWTFEREELARMLVIERVETDEGETYQVDLSSQLLRSFLESIAPGLYIEQENAKFMFNDDTLELELIQPSVTGQSLDVTTSLKMIQERVAAGEHKITLDLEYSLPAVTSECNR